MKTAEELLCDNIEIGGSNLFLICEDLKDYIKKGLLLEIPIDCNIDEILSLKLIKSEQDYYGNRLTKPLTQGRGLETSFRTVPGGVIYKLKFWDSERAGYYGVFKKDVPSAVSG
jgi:hypothetical protein